jgi:hypothetical protein
MNGFIETPSTSQSVQTLDGATTVLSQEKFEQLFIGLALAAALIKRPAALPRVHRIVRGYLRQRRPCPSCQPRRIGSKPLRIKHARARAIHSHVSHGGSRAPPGDDGSSSSDGIARPGGRASLGPVRTSPNGVVFRTHWGRSPHSPTQGRAFSGTPYAITFRSRARP